MIFLEHAISLWETRLDGSVLELSAYSANRRTVRANSHTFV